MVPTDCPGETDLTRVDAEPAQVDPYIVEFVAFIIREAAFTADLTADYLGLLLGPPAKRGPNERPIGLPKQFLIELGAILRIAVWERAGLEHLLCSGFPSAQQALAELLSRYLDSPTLVEELDTGLALRVLKVMCRRLAFGGLQHLQADVILDRPDDPTFLVGLAELLWANRHLASAGEELT
jgi:hypothetical protein